MKINDFQLERYFAKHEFSAKYLLSSSDCDGFELKYILGLASEEELEMWNKLTLGYTESAGHPLLRESILKNYAINDIQNVVVATPGELNFIAMNVLLHPGDHVISIAPAYQSLSEIAASLKCDVSFWKPNSENWYFDTGELKSLIKGNTKLIVLNFPHNPTGSYLTLSQVREIVTIARQHNLTIFSDEMYYKLSSGETKELPPICDIYENGISLWGTSKSFGMAGLRVGWLVSQNRNFLDKVVAFKDYLSICNSAPGEILSIIALNNLNHFLEVNIKKIQKNIRLFQKFSEEHEIIHSFIPPQAGSTSFVKLNIETTAVEFSNLLVKEAGIMTVPAEMFGWQGKYIRIGFGRENFSSALTVFAEYLKNKACT